MAAMRALLLLAVWLATTTVAYETFRRIRLVRALRAQREIVSK